MAPASRLGRQLAELVAAPAEVDAPLALIGGLALAAAPADDTRPVQTLDTVDT